MSIFEAISLYERRPLLLVACGLFGGGYERLPLLMVVVAVVACALEM
jgi:hypothetical protein